MNWRGDDRAQSVQVGAILLFATLVIALSIYQATIVPSQNADIEYKHSQTVQNQMADVRNSILRSAATGTTQPTSLTMGTQYPARVFLLNPPPSTGTLRTGSYDDGTVRVSNVNATNPETREFLNGSWTASTKFLEYEPDYNEYDNAPNLLYESSILSNYYPNSGGGTAIPLTDQLLVDNETRTITLVTLNGSLSTTRAGSVTVSPESLSAPYQRVQVTNNTSGPVNVSVPTWLSADQFENRTDLGNHPGVIDVVDVPDENRVVVQVNWTDRFTLQTARVGVGSGTDNPGPHYLTLVENRGDRVTVEARDRFNNAESGVKVDINDEAKNNSLFEDSSLWTDENGRATFEVNGNKSGTATIWVNKNSTEYERVDDVYVNGDTGSSNQDNTDSSNPSISFRLDDLTHTNENAVEYVGSYSVSNTNSSFQRVEIQYQNTNQGTASQTLQKAGERGGLRYTSTYGAGDAYDVTFRVVYSGPDGEYNATTRTITDVADAANPNGNGDLSTESTATLSSSPITDRSNNGQGPRYRLNYDISAGGYSQTRFVAVATDSGGKDSAIGTARSGTLDVSPGYGNGQSFKLAVLVYGPDGAVVDARIAEDSADGTGP